MAYDRAIRRELCRKIVDIRLSSCGFRAEHADDSRFRILGGRLDCRDRADDGQIECRPNMFKRDCRRGVARNDGEAWAISLDEAAEQGGHSAGDFGFVRLPR
jgi:hypothetical protein